jgi:hypothetical protein
MVRGFKPQYPFVDDRPQPPPDWFFAFYQDGPAAGISEPQRHYRGERDFYADWPSGGSSMTSTSQPLGLLSAPGTYGSFGLTPGPMPSG